jgi:hypothetical protein
MLHHRATSTIRALPLNWQMATLAGLMSRAVTTTIRALPLVESIA